MLCLIFSLLFRTVRKRRGTSGFCRGETTLGNRYVRVEYNWNRNIRVLLMGDYFGEQVCPGRILLCKPYIVEFSYGYDKSIYKISIVSATGTSR